MTQMVLDIPLSILEATMIASFSYFWVGLQPGANHFFYFVSVLIGLEFVGQAFGRLLCAPTRKQVYANTLSSVFLLVFGTVAGFMPGYSSIPRALQWLSWFTPASYAFEGIMLNEFVGLDLSIVTLTTGNGTTARGDMNGEQRLGCMSLPRKEWATYQGMKDFNIFMLFFLAVFFDLLGCYFTESRRDVYFNQIRRPQRTTRSTSFYKIKDTARKSSEARSASSHSDWPTSLSVDTISYFVSLKVKKRPLRFSMHSFLGPYLVRCFSKKPGKAETLHGVTESGRKLCLLNNVSARFTRGRMTALMGTSGAGKTTLLDVIAGYKTGGRIEGTVMIGSQEKDASTWRSISAYVGWHFEVITRLACVHTCRH